MEEFICELCRELPENPVILPCCFQSVCRSHVHSDCPLCLTSLRGQQTTFNTLLNAALQGSHALCQRCQSSEPKLRCKQCQVDLCEGCALEIHKMGVYKSHIMVPREIGQMMAQDLCFQHNRELVFFCTDDWQALCEACLDNHSDHAILSLEEALCDMLYEIECKEHYVQTIACKVAQSTNRLRYIHQSIERNGQSAISSVKQEFTQMKQLLLHKEEEIIGELEHQKLRKIVQVNSLLESYSVVSKRAKAISCLLTSAKDLPASKVFACLQYLSMKIQEVLDNQDIPSIDISPQLTYDVDFSRIKQAVEIIDSKEELSVCSSVSSKSQTPRNTSNLKQRQSSRGVLHVSNRNSMNMDPRQSQNLKRRSITPTQSRQNSILDQNPLQQRSFVKKLMTSNTIQVSWSHGSRLVPDLVYCLQYGVGTKINSVEQFRQVYKGQAYTCIITDLLPKTSYRFRVCPMLASTSEQGDWSEITTITTYQTQKIDPNSCRQHASIISRGSEKWIQFDRSGIVTGSFPYSFGKHCWEVKVLNSALFGSESQSFIKIGVISGKSKQVYGCQVGCGGKGAINVKVVLDIENGVMVCYSPNSPSGEYFNQLPDLPLLPAFHHKPSKNSFNLKFMVNFDKSDN